MRLIQAYGPDRFGISFELFPPKTVGGETALYKNVAELMKFKPDFVTCTYGAGGSTREKTLDIVSGVSRDYQCSVAAHLTCVGLTVDQLRDYLQEATRRGIENIVALRGDPPQGDTSFKAAAGGFSNANELVAMIADEFPDLGVAVAGYPETHVEAESPEADLNHLKTKVDAGADIVMTQLFYDNRDYLEFRDRCHRVGIKVPIVPGILPIISLPQIRRITSLCGAKLPPSLCSALEDAAEDADKQFRVGVEFAAKQVQELIDNGVPGLHFYVLNKSLATTHVLRSVDLPSRG